MNQRVNGLPESVRIGPEVYDIVPTILADETEWGECDYRDKTISVDSRLGRYERQVTFFHEWFHVVARRAGWDALLPEETIEGLCDVIAYGLADLLYTGTLTLNVPD